MVFLCLFKLELGAVIDIFIWIFGIRVFLVLGIKSWKITNTEFSDVFSASGFLIQDRLLPQEWQL